MLRFLFGLRFFLLERDRKHKNLGNLIPYKIMYFSATYSRSKTVEEDAFFVAKVQFFRGMEKHIVT